VPDDEPLDESWAEPAAFDGCASRGQSRPGQAQPIAIVRPASIQGARS
jgi:nitrate reductase delta subunit